MQIFGALLRRVRIRPPVASTRAAAAGILLLVRSGCSHNRSRTFPAQVLERNQERVGPELVTFLAIPTTPRITQFTDVFVDELPIAEGELSQSYEILARLAPLPDRFLP
eukprot:TRINITY_DN2906_c0_g1_i1.p2 TRINITY_DN2906_c0_g1~~TRINITY_DN2906_c0_g1_i1.p2  ORF type:complete len:109 (+),score=6.88 TRINITY_DN2906_c0_g1_i1:257-583(+)